MDELLIVSILNKDEKTACESIANGANVNQMVRQKHIVETPDGVVRSLCNERIETPLIMACRLDLSKVVSTLLENKADLNLIDNGKAFNEYKNRHQVSELVFHGRKISRHNQQTSISNEGKIRD